jgi:Carboxypeptidase regulatory-like domain
MMRKICNVLLILVSVICFNVNVEASTISGKVLDVEGNGIANAIVQVEGQTLKATTTKDGFFKISNIPDGNVFLTVSTPSKKYLDSETLKSIKVMQDATVADIRIVLSGRPSDIAEYVGINECKTCHEDQWPDIFQAFDGSPNASIHSRMVNAGTSQMIYPELWPDPGSHYLPLDPKGNLLMVQDPLDGKGLVNLVLCTEDSKNGRKYLFKFYPEQPDGKSLPAEKLDGSRKTKNAIWIPIGGTIGGQGKWGEGYIDPDHKKDDKYHDFGEGKQRFLARVQDVPYLKKWMTDNGVPVEKAKQDYVAYMPVYIMQDGTPTGSKVLAKGDTGSPKFWQKGPTHWCPPTNTLSRGCAGCHATGTRIKTKDVLDDPKHPFKSVVTAFDYKDLNITCERCHGPGSEHASSEDILKIIQPQYLTAKASNEVCGQCHGSHSGKSEYPMGIHKYPYNKRVENLVGHGYFVPGIYDLDDFYFNNDKPSINNTWKEGTYNTWPDMIHARAHSMQLSELKRSVHGNNQNQKLTCSSCHDVHSLDGGPASLVVSGYDYKNAAYNNNTLCLACHSGEGDFKNVTNDDVALLQLEAGFKVTKDGSNYSPGSNNLILAKGRVAKDVAKHMQKGAGMGGALYTPEDQQMPTGSCISCHMAKIGKLFDLNDDAQYHLALDKSGKNAVAEGNAGNHVFDIVWPGQSSILKNPDPSKGHDYDIMPNSCSKCHDFARLSGDKD